jgi:signal transduction histidine kinase
LRAVEPAAAVPLLVVRVRDMERVAWREGRAAARIVERSSLRSFVATASRVLRATDLIAHDRGSEDFLAALVSPTRRVGAVAAPADCRATLARLASAMAVDGRTHVESGWTILETVGADDRLVAAIETALERGARERERYAFFSTVGHELRTPLTSIRGYLETLLEQDLPPETVRRFLEIALSEATRMGRLVDGMFDVSMLDLRPGPSRDESCSLRRALADAVRAVAPMAAERKTSVGRVPPCEYDVAIGADRLAQSAINLLENAIKHGREGGHIALSVRALGARYVEVCVDDDGPGVLAAEREAIFAFAKRGANASSRGTGIGLAVVRLVIERIGGEVDVTDSPLGGARFRIRLPLHGSARASA